MAAFHGGGSVREAGVHPPQEAQLPFLRTLDYHDRKLLPPYVLKPFAFLLTFSSPVSLTWPLVLSHMFCHRAMRDIRIRYVTELPLLGEYLSVSWIKCVSLWHRKKYTNKIISKPTSL